METLTVHIHSLARVHIELTDFPDLSSMNRLVKRGLDLLRSRAPKFLRYLSRQKVLSNLSAYEIVVHTAEAAEEKHVRRVFGIWLQRQKLEKLLCVIGEMLVIPFTAILTPIPGPNMVFYFIFVLFYFHLKTYLSLRRTHAHSLRLRLAAPAQET